MKSFAPSGVYQPGDLTFAASVCKCCTVAAPAAGFRLRRAEEALPKEPTKAAKSKHECPQCGSVLSVQPDVTFCPSCGWRNPKVSIEGWAEDQERAKRVSFSHWESYDTEGDDADRHEDGTLNGPFPPDLNRWNWGAFAFSWLWAISHNLWLFVVIGFILWGLGVGLIVGGSPFFYVTFFGMVAMGSVLGAAGNRMAWQARRFSGRDEFVECQQVWEAWAIVGAILWVLQVIAGVMMMTQI